MTFDVSLFLKYNIADGFAEVSVIAPLVIEKDLPSVAAVSAASWLSASTSNRLVSLTAAENPAPEPSWMIKITSFLISC